MRAGLMCTDDFDWAGYPVTRTIDRDVRCDCGRVIPAGVEHDALIEDLDGEECLACLGFRSFPLVDDYGHEINWRRNRALEGIVETPIDWAERHCLCGNDEADFDVAEPFRRRPQEAVMCGLCALGARWLDHHCDGNFSSIDIVRQIVDHDVELQWPSYQDRAIISAARDNWRHIDTSCLAGLVRVAVAL